MNTVVSTTKTSYQSVGAAENNGRRDEESATLMSRDENVSTTSKSSSSSNGGVSLKTVAYGLGVVALACSGSFVAGRSAARYKLAQTRMAVQSTTTSPSHIPRLGNKQHHSTAHSMAAAKKKKMSSDDASSSPKEEEEAKKTTEDEPADPADPETMT